jgi:16S rRNA (cytidine1402-2'-O)-methyltransferase
VALCHSGLPATDVRFLGFPARGGTQRKAVLDGLRHERATVVLYEAANRVPALLQDLARTLPDASTRDMAVARELTKLHQEVVRGTVAELAATLQDELRGEVTVVLGPGTLPEADAEAIAARAALDVVLDPLLKPREKARRLAQLTGLDSRELYDRLVRTSEGT